MLIVYQSKSLFEFSYLNKKVVFFIYLSIQANLFINNEGLKQEKTLTHLTHEKIKYS